jgi:hypothetical protein
MVQLKHTRTFDKLRHPAEVLEKVREWAKAKGICREDASVVKAIGTKEQIEELDALVKGKEEKSGS